MPATEQDRIAILIELPRGDADMSALRRLLKSLIRTYGLKCLAIRRPEETKTFKPEDFPPAKPK